MIKCQGCGHELHETADSCPKCGAKVQQEGAFGLIMAIVGISVTAFALYSLFSL